jgi:hypothetical protein
LQADAQDFMLPGANESTLLREVDDVAVVEHKKPKN